MNTWKVIGISGATNSGKTSLVKFLLEKFPGSVSLCQDKYFRDPNSDRHVIIPELNHQNWERPESVDWDSMMSDVHKILTDSRPASRDAVFLIEGHIIYNHSPLRNVFDRRYFLTIDREACFTRRCQRAYVPPDPPGYFDMCVWPMYLSNKSEMEAALGPSQVVYVDSSSIPKDKIQNIVYEDIKKHVLHDMTS